MSRESGPTGTTIPIQVSFSGLVSVVGTPQLALNTSPARSAAYQTGTGTNVLTFTYTVQAGDNAAVLDYTATTALSIVSAAIRNGSLVPILAEWHHVEPVPLFATYPSGRNLSPKVRAMVDFLVAEFGSAPWRQAHV